MASNWQKLPNPPQLREFPFNVFARFLPGRDIRATAEQRESFRRFAHAGDPLADAVVAMFARFPVGQGRRMFETAIEEGIDAVENPPEELVAFFEQIDARPYWLDDKKLELAARVSMRTGVVGLGLALPGLALTGGYLSSRADKPLVGTGNLQAMAPRRLNETAQWLIDVTSPGGLDRFSPGFKGIPRVRLMHALVRAAMNRRDDWDYEAWDSPVNQIQLAGTLMLFSLANLAGCQAMGMSFSDSERESVFHFWRYVGLLMGIHPELVPTSEEDTWRLFWLEADTEFLPDDDSYALTQDPARLDPRRAGVHAALSHLPVLIQPAHSRQDQRRSLRPARQQTDASRRRGNLGDELVFRAPQRAARNDAHQRGDRPVRAAPDRLAGHVAIRRGSHLSTTRQSRHRELARLIY
ncbi:oxygenase MpaB family protein [Mycobacteroides abscessus]